MTTIKITELSDIGVNLASSTVLPVVNMAGTPVTQKTNIGNIANIILEGAGVDYPEASVALLAQTVSNAAQPNITSVGTLSNITVSGNASINGNITSNGTSYLGNISTTGLASITTLNVGTTANLGSVNNVIIEGGTDGQVLTTDGDGNLSWTTVSSGNSSYGDSNVVTLLSAFGSNTITTTGNISVGNITANNLGNISTVSLTGSNSNVLYGNGVFAPVTGGNGTYGNSDVATFLAAFGSNTITTTGNISGGNLVTGGQVVATGNVSSGTGLSTGGFLSVDGTADLHDTTVTGNLSATGNITANNLGNISATNLTGSNSNVLYGNGVFAAIAGGNSSQISNGNSNVSVPVSNGNVVINATGTASWSFNANGSIQVPNNGAILAAANSSAILGNSNGTMKFFVEDDGAYVQTSNGANTFISVFQTDGDFAPAGNIVFPGGSYMGEVAGNTTIGIAAEPNHSIVLQTSNGNSGASWTFDTSGNTILSDQGVIKYSNGAIYGSNFTGNITFSGTTISSNVAQDIEIDASGNSNVKITGNSKTWNFQSNGALTYPDGTLMFDTSNVFVVASGNFALSMGANANVAARWDFNADGNLTLPGNTFAVNYANGTAVTIPTVGNIATINLDGNVSNLLTGNGTYVAIPVVPTVGNIATLNLDGSNSNVLYGNGVFAAVAGGGNGTPGGSNTQIQFNDNGNFGANSGFTFDSTTGNIGIPGIIIGSNTIEFDNRATGNGADINLYSADDILLQARDRDAGSTSEGGDINIFAGDSAEDSDASGGDIVIEAGQGGAANLDFGGDGGFVRIEAGAGGAAVGANISARSGGSLTLNAGNAGGNNGNIDLGNSGGDVTINAGDSTGNGDPGGDIILRSGDAGANALAGQIQLIISSSDNGDGGTWTFNGAGIFELPNSGTIGNDGNNIDIGSTSAISLEASSAVNIYTDTGTNAWQWQFQDDGNLRLPTIELDVGNTINEQTVIQSQRKIIPGLRYSAVIVGTTPTVVYTATSVDTTSMKVTMQIQHSGLGFEFFDVSATSTDGNTYYTVSNRVQPPTISNSTVVVDLNGSNFMDITVTINSGAANSWVTYDATEFGIAVD
jgi:hypothetical protein